MNKIEYDFSTAQAYLNRHYTPEALANILQTSALELSGVIMDMEDAAKVTDMQMSVLTVCEFLHSIYPKGGAR